MTNAQKEKIEFYDNLIETNPNFERKGKTMPYTSANGYMFSLLNKDGEIGIRLSKEQDRKFMEQHDSSIFKSYGSVMGGYVLIPEKLYEDMQLLATYLNDSYEYVTSLKAK